MEGHQLRGTGSNYFHEVTPHPPHGTHSLAREVPPRHFPHHGCWEGIRRTSAVAMDERITRTLVPRPSYGLRFAAEGVRGQSSRSGSMRNATQTRLTRFYLPLFTSIDDMRQL